MKIYSLAIVLALCVGACQNKQKPGSNQGKTGEKTALDSQLALAKFLPFKGDQPYIFKVNNAQGGKLSTQRGSKVFVPSGAVVHMDGSEVKGDYQIEFKEFHTIIDFLTSGVIMGTKDANGDFQPFISDGMFSISAVKDGEPLKIADNKKIDVAVAAFKGDGDYPLWKYNESTKQWEKAGEPVKALKSSEVDQVVLQQKDKSWSAWLAKAEIWPPAWTFLGLEFNKFASFSNQYSSEQDPSSFQKVAPLQTDLSTAFELQLDVDKFPNLIPYEDAIWQCVGFPTKGAHGINTITDVFNQKWDEVEMIENSDQTFTLKLKSNQENGRKYARLELVKYGQAGNRKVENAGKVSVEGIKAQKEKSASINKETAEQMVAKFSRIVKISNFGMYNCDQFARATNLTKIDFDGVTTSGSPISSTKSFATVYVLDNETNSCVYYYPKIGINIDMFDQAVMIHETGVYTINPEQMKTIKSKKRQGQITENIQWVMVSSLAKLKEVFDSPNSLQ